MRFLHLSDLHLGKRLNEFSLLEGQAFILDQILSIARDRQVDGVLIAGDVYDKSVPSGEAVELFDSFLTGLAALGTEVFVISGNHDSAQRMAFGSRLLDRCRIHLSPVFDGEVRSTVLTVVESDYVEAARACGTGDARIILRHILPNAIGPIIVQTTTSISDMILTASGLSFIGMGVQAPTPEWGAMISEAREFYRQKPYLVIFPGVCIILTALSFNLIGDGLRDALDPRLRD